MKYGLVVPCLYKFRGQESTVLLARKILYTGTCTVQILCMHACYLSIHMFMHATVMVFKNMMLCEFV